MRRILPATLLLLVLVACVGARNLRKQAAFDLQCPEDNLQITELGKTTRGVQGCGRQASYVCTDAAAGAINCKEWRINSDTNSN